MNWRIHGNPCEHWPIPGDWRQATAMWWSIGPGATLSCMWLRPRVKPKRPGTIPPPANFSPGSDLRRSESAAQPRLNPVLLNESNPTRLSNASAIFRPDPGSRSVGVKPEPAHFAFSKRSRSRAPAAVHQSPTTKKSRSRYGTGRDAPSWGGSTKYQEPRPLRALAQFLAMVRTHPASRCMLAHFYPGAPSAMGVRSNLRP